MYVQAALEVRDTKIADELIQNILQVSYQGLSAKLKKVRVHLCTYILHVLYVNVLFFMYFIALCFVLPITPLPLPTHIFSLPSQLHTYAHLQDISVLHRRFIDECFKRLDDLLDGGKPAKTSTSKITSPALKLQAIERLLLLAQRYITVVEVRETGDLEI